MIERRNDIGAKVLIGVVSLLLGVIMTITWATAREALGTTHTNKIDLTRLEISQLNIKETLREIKTDIKEIKEAIIK